MYFCITEPENWSPNAMYQATKIFSSNLSVKKAQCFDSLLLSSRVFCYHFVIGTCTLQEAVNIISIIQKASIRPLHSSAALMRLAELEYCGTTSYFIKLFFGKEYALPYRVLDVEVAHFMRFLEETRIMSFIWHQSVLAFVQRYKNELNKDQHNLVTP
ncbi:hypothetical protein OPV22_011996 [Ensete ventricosum]|uniref:PRELI/MSF1 domain-containing protein n=1 Tax=Ensete ventricosum TaxID=4639 RepID=A0AAV8QW28_ENSVE|nr:hypothetical protein OPV22_011996 [Ensete ventricosum]